MSLLPSLVFQSFHCIPANHVMTQQLPHGSLYFLISEGYKSQGSSRKITVWKRETALSAGESLKGGCRWKMAGPNMRNTVVSYWCMWTAHTLPLRGVPLYTAWGWLHRRARRRHSRSEQVCSQGPSGAPPQGVIGASLMTCGTSQKKLSREAVWTTEGQVDNESHLNNGMSKSPSHRANSKGICQALGFMTVE